MEIMDVMLQCDGLRKNTKYDVDTFLPEDGP
jgi:hypothetical protein